MADIERIQLNDGRKIMIKCQVAIKIPQKDSPSKSIMINEKRSFKMDSGSAVTCVSASRLGIRIDENAFMSWAEKNRIEGIRPYSIGCKGIDSNTSSIEFYYIQTDHFFLQNIDLGSVPIYISFDPRFKKFLLGMDLMKLINYSVDNDKDEMTISLSAKYEEYKKTHLRTTIKSMYEMGIYSVKDADTDSMIMIE